MKLTNKTAGFGIVAVAGLMSGGAVIVDTMGHDIGSDRKRKMSDHPMMDIAAMDANKDGKVSKEEIAIYRTAQAAAVDVNGDGNLSVEELAARQLKAMTEAATTMAQRMVGRLDTDGDKLLSAAELASPPSETDMFDRLDTNKDSFVVQSELDTC